MLRPGPATSPRPQPHCVRGGQDQRAGDRGWGGLAAGGSPRVLLGVSAQAPRKAGRGHQGEKRYKGLGGGSGEGGRGKRVMSEDKREESQRRRASSRYQEGRWEASELPGLHRLLSGAGVCVLVLLTT